MSKITKMGNPPFSSSNPFDSDSETEQNCKTPRASLIHRSTPPPLSSFNPFDSDSESEVNCKPPRDFSAPVMSKGSLVSSPGYSDREGRCATVASRNRFRNDSRDLESEKHRKTPRASLAHCSTTPFSSSSPFDSDSEVNCKPPRAFSAPVMSKRIRKTTSGYSENEGRCATVASSNRYRNDFRDSRGIENQSVQELEDYAVYKAEETTQKVHECLKIAEEMREGACRTLVNLHQQGEQITQSHLVAANIEQDLSTAEKLLGSLGGLFSRTWRPKKMRDIQGPILTKDEQYTRRVNHIEQRQKLGLSPSPINSRSHMQDSHSEPKCALEKVGVDKAKQDDALSDLSSLLGELKNMALDMGGEIDRQNTALDHLDDDVQELNFRVRGANVQGLRLLRK